MTLGVALRDRAAPESATETMPEAASQPEWHRAMGLHQAMGMTGAAALASGMLNALAAKILAVLAGAAAVAWLATLQQIRQVAVTASTGGGQAALVRVASACEGRKRREFLRTAAVIFTAATVLVGLIILVAPRWVAEKAGLGPAGAGAARWMVFPVVLSAVFVFLSGLLNALGGIRDLALLQIAAGAVLAGGAWPVSQRIFPHQLGPLRPEFLAGLLGLSAAASVGGASWALWMRRDQWSGWFTGVGKIWAGDAARQFAGVSLSLLVSGIAASGVLLIVRARIAEAQGWTVTAQFDAAWSISMSYVTLVLGSMQTYYLPALAGTRSVAQRNLQISRVLTNGTLLAAMLIAVVAFLKPHLLVWLYSASFRPGTRYLRWTLLGDYLKVSSWILSIPILAAAEMKVFLAADLAGCAVFLGAAIGLHPYITAATSAGVAFVLMYATHLLICAIYVMRRQGFFPTRQACWAWTGGMAAVAAASAFTWNLA